MINTFCRKNTLFLLKEQTMQVLYWKIIQITEMEFYNSVLVVSQLTQLVLPLINDSSYGSIPSLQTVETMVVFW